MSKRNRRNHARSARGESSTLTLGDQNAGHRHARLEHILHDEIQELLREEAADPALEGIQLLGVQLSPDAGHARIAYAVLGALDEEPAIRHRTDAAFQRATPFIRSRLAAQLNLKRVPRLSFTFVGIAQPEGGPPCRG